MAQSSFLLPASLSFPVNCAPFALSSSNCVFKDTQKEGLIPACLPHCSNFVQCEHNSHPLISQGFQPVLKLFWKKVANIFGNVKVLDEYCEIFNH